MYIITPVFYRFIKRSYLSIRLDNYISIRGLIINYIKTLPLFIPR